MNTDKTRRLWAAFFPADREPVAGDEVDRLARHAPSVTSQAEHAAEGAARVMNALSDGPFPLEAFAAGIAEVQQRLRPQGAARELRELAATLNAMMFEQMATVCDTHFEAGQLDEALRFVEGPVWRQQGLSAEMAGFTDALDRWHRERVVPLIEGYRAHLEHQAPRPVLPLIEAEDGLVVRLLRARGLDPDMKQTVVTHAKAWEQHASTSSLREAGLWPGLVEELAQDGFWRRYAIASHRALWTSSELERLAEFYESAAGQKLNTLMARWTEANEQFLQSDPFKAKVMEWIESLVP